MSPTTISILPHFIARPSSMIGRAKPYHHLGASWYYLPSRPRISAHERSAGCRAQRLAAPPGPVDAVDSRDMEKPVTRRQQRRRILIVNDSQEILDVLRDLLEEEGYEVVVYSYAIRDLEEVKRVNPDLIILDFIINEETAGWQMLQKLKLDRETAGIPVIVCTAAAGLVRELEGHLRAKSVAVVLKPFDIDDLLTEINQSWERASDDAAHVSARLERNGNKNTDEE
ncbi:MAG: hypothetical protein C4345_05985 [Chloroflexota bacterium]